MKWLAIAFALEVGLLPQDATIMYAPPEMMLIREDPAFYQTLEVEATMFGVVSIGSRLEIFDWIKQGKLYFFPHRLGSAFWVSAGWGPVELGWRHYCTHPIVPYFPILAQQMRWEGAYDEIFLRLEGGWR